MKANNLFAWAQLLAVTAGLGLGAIALACINHRPLAVALFAVATVLAMVVTYRYDHALRHSHAVARDHADTERSHLLNEITQLRAQLASVGNDDPGVVSPKESWPDDTDIDGVIAEAECFEEALFDIAEKYGANVTNNMQRWQDGVFLREVGGFIGDIKTAAAKHLN